MKLRRRARAQQETAQGRGVRMKQLGGGPGHAGAFYEASPPGPRAARNGPRGGGGGGPLGAGGAGPPATRMLLAGHRARLVEAIERIQSIEPPWRRNMSPVAAFLSCSTLLRP
jgi:hypothetical protein